MNSFVCLAVTVLIAVLSVSTATAENNTTEAELEPKPRIIAGEEAAPAEFPFMVSIQLEDKSTPGTGTGTGTAAVWKHKCGGALVGTSHVLTAAHCIEIRAGKDHSVVLGAHDITDENEVGRQRVIVKGFKIHPEYNFTTGDYDIAVLELLNSVTYSQQVKPIKLAIEDNYPVGHKCKVMGWGSNFLNFPPPHILQKASMVIQWQTVCGKNKPLRDPHICADEHPQGLCAGDGGAPLMCPHPYSPRDFVLIGIASKPENPCKLGNRPGVFTRISHPNVLSFIKQHATSIHKEPEPVNSSNFNHFKIYILLLFVIWWCIPQVHF